MLRRRYSRPKVAEERLLAVVAECGGSSIDRDTADKPIRDP
jgi:hypothetical protein